MALTVQLTAGEYQVAIQPDTGEMWLQTSELTLRIPKDLLAGIGIKMLDAVPIGLRR